MATRVLGELAAEKLVEARRREDGGYDVALTPEGRAFYGEHAAYARRTFGRMLVDHFRYGRPPAWAATLVATDG